MRKNSFICRECGYVSPKWLGRCPGCGQWNTITEEAAPVRSGPGGGRAPAPLRLSDVDLGAQARVSSGLAEFDRVLGGGLVPGSVVLVGGEPGIGKSTLLLQALLDVERRDIPAILVSGEESAAPQRGLLLPRLLLRGVRRDSHHHSSPRLNRCTAHKPSEPGHLRQRDHHLSTQALGGSHRSRWL